MKKKIKIIDAICERHPSLGIERGWSEYVGGMADTGRWFFRIMLDVPIEELQSFLDGIIAEENKPIECQPSSGVIHIYKDSWVSQEEQEMFKKMFDDLDKKILGL